LSSVLNTILGNLYLKFTWFNFMLSYTNNNSVTIWKKQADGSWKNVVDISTPN